MKTALSLIVTCFLSIHSFATYKDTPTSEIGAALIRYNGIHKNYEDFLKNYPLMEFDLDQHKKIVESLKEKVLDRKMDNTTFDAIYLPEKKKLAELLSKARKITYNTISIEEDYRRNDAAVTKLYHDVEAYITKVK